MSGTTLAEKCVDFVAFAIDHWQTSTLGGVAAFAGYVASLHGPHAPLWARIAAVATLLLGASAADASKAK